MGTNKCITIYCNDMYPDTFCHLYASLLGAESTLHLVNHDGPQPREEHYLGSLHLFYNRLQVLRTSEPESFRPKPISRTKILRV